MFEKTWRVLFTFSRLRAYANRRKDVAECVELPGGLVLKKIYEQAIPS